MKGHSHGAKTTNRVALTKALVLTGGFLIVEVIGGIVTGSLALISDAAHMLTDTIGLAIGLAGMKLGEMPPDTRRTFGYQRFEILAASFNALMLFGVAAYILYEGYRRIVEPAQIHSFGMLVIATVGLVVNLIAMRLLREGKDKNLNVRGAYLEVWSDMLGSIGVIAAAIVIWLTGWVWVDALVAIGIGLWVLPRSWGLLKETVNLLLEGVPDGIDLEAVATALKESPGVRNVHDLHIWALSSELPSLSAHLVIVGGTEGDGVRRAVAEMLDQRFHITHVTLQTEATDCRQEREHGLH